MKAAFKKGSKVSVRECRLPPIEADQIRLRVDACGVCGTDLHVQPGNDSEAGFGHEIAGTVLETGNAVKHVAVGDRVVLDSSTPCGKCAHCRNAAQELCTNLASFWPLATFGFAEEMLAPAVCAFRYEGLQPDVACLQEPLGVAIDMVRLAQIDIDSNVLLIGPGPIGLMALALARRAGARRLFVAGHKRRTRRVELAAAFGADAFIDPEDSPPAEHDFGCPINRILVTAPPSTLGAAFDIAAKGAIISFIGIEHGDGAFCRFDVNKFHFKKLQLRASFASPALFGPRAVQYLREGVVDGDALVSHRYPLEKLETAMETARTDATAVKVVVMP